MSKTDNTNEIEFGWIAEEADYCLSYNTHPIARCLAEDNADNVYSHIFLEESE